MQSMMVRWKVSFQRCRPASASTIGQGGSAQAATHSQPAWCAEAATTCMLRRQRAHDAAQPSSRDQ